MKHTLDSLCRFAAPAVALAAILGCGESRTKNKLQQIRQGIDNVQAHSETIQDEARPAATPDPPAPGN